MEIDIDKLVSEMVLTDAASDKEKIARKIIRAAQEQGVFLASIHDFYAARGRGEIEGFTVPAMNLRTLTYDTARAIIRSAMKINAGAFIFEIAKSEMGYTGQSPVEYVSMCLAAALKEGYVGPVFIQGDHFQVNAKKFAENRDKEIETLRGIISDAVGAGFLNIDIDSSTLVDLEQKDLYEQQRNNFEVCAELTKYIRQIQPEGVTISVGGEIGEVGCQNSTPEDLEAFMRGYTANLPEGVTGISKISIQTGTSHGGVVLPDGSIAEVKLDFNALRDISKIGRAEYGIGGTVQHGASTLPDEAFHKFPANDTLEVHLATGFQNIIYESDSFPKELRNKIYEWLNREAAGEKKSGESEEQFLYKTRKKALGPFKKEIYNIGTAAREAIGRELEAKFDFLFKELKIADTKKMIDNYIEKTTFELAAGQADFSQKSADELEGAD